MRHATTQNHLRLMKMMGVQSVEATGVGVSWPKTGLPQGEYVSSWGQDGAREVAKQFAGEFTLKSGGQVSAHTSCKLPSGFKARRAGLRPDLLTSNSCAPPVSLCLERRQCILAVEVVLAPLKRPALGAGDCEGCGHLQ